MELRQEITLMNGKKANHESISIELLKDGSNVFLRNVENGQLID